MENGVYLCKVNGMEFCSYAILKFINGIWWIYERRNHWEGWVNNDLEIVEVRDMIEKLD